MCSNSLCFYFIFYSFSRLESALKIDRFVSIRFPNGKWRQICYWMKTGPHWHLARCLRQVLAVLVAFSPLCVVVTPTVAKPFSRKFRQVSPSVFMFHSGLRCGCVCDLFELNTCVWIVKKLFLFRFIVGWWRSRHFRYFIIGQNHLINAVRVIVLKWSLTNAEFREDAYAASIQTKDHKMHQKHNENARSTDNYRFAGLAPIQ